MSKVNDDVRVLIVDDQLLVRSILLKHLKSAGVKNLHEATDGAKALALVKKQKEEGKPVHVIFLDWNMPEMSGYDFLIEAKKQNLLDGVGVIMVTAESEKHKVMQALTAGVSDYVVKPFSQGDIIKKLTKHVKT